MALSTVVGTSIPNLKLSFLSRAFTAAIIKLRFLSTLGTHQAKAGSSLIPTEVAYSAVSIGQSFNSAKFTQEVVPLLHSTQSFHPLVVFFCCRRPLCMKYCRSLVMAVESFVWSMMAFSNIVVSRWGRTEHTFSLQSRLQHTLHSIHQGIRLDKSFYLL
jgi:hypothetical protein